MCLETLNDNVDGTYQQYFWVVYISIVYKIQLQ